MSHAFNSRAGAPGRGERWGHWARFTLRGFAVLAVGVGALTGDRLSLAGAAAGPEPVSVCFGTNSKGRLERGVQLPESGPNFVSYGRLPRWLGRTYVHSKVRDVVLGAYARLEVEQPGKIFKYGETGLAEGGRFEPHKTHQNGRSVDFMVPVIDGQGQPVPLPTNLWNKYGYDVEFDRAGAYDDYRIDFEAIGAHLVALHRASLRHGIGIRRVIFAPDLQSKLYATAHGRYIRKHIRIPTKRSWVRHDDHYHVDFAIDCRRL